MIAVSACLIGNNTKYDGGNNYNQYVIDYLKGKDYIVICPEVLGGMSTPRYPSEQIGNKIINTNNEDVTNYFNDGAIKTLDVIKANNITEVILKERSPSCGYKKVYDGSFSHTTIDGNGAFVKMLLAYDKNIIIHTESDIKNLMEK